MSGTRGAGQPGLACTGCSRPFGFAVMYCPFCGIAQQQLQPVSVPDTQAPPAPPPEPPVQPQAPVQPQPPVQPVVRVAEARAVPAAPVAAARTTRAYPAAGAAKAAVKQPALKQPEPRRPRRFRTAAGLAVIAVMAWFAIGHRPEAILVVSVQPAADGAVLVDGSRAGRAGERLHVRVGSHTIGFDAAGWSAPTRQVAFGNGQTRTLRLDLIARPAVLTFRPDPADAVIRLDGRVLDAAGDEHKVAPGWHRLVVTHPGFAPLTLPMVLGRGERRVVPLRLSPLPVRMLEFQAPVGTWSDPVTLPARTDFTLAFSGRLRLRVGRDVYLLGPDGSVNLGDVRARSIQMKAVDDQPVAVRLLLRSEN